MTTTHYVSDDALRALVHRSAFFTVFTLLREAWVLPPVVQEFIRQWEATSFPMQRLAMVRGLLLDTELLTKPWPEPARRQALLLLDKAIREYRERLSRPVEKLTIPPPKDQP